MIIDVINACKCCGCGACSQICPVGAIEVRENVNGFLNAVLDESKCVQCGLCALVCPTKRRDEDTAVIQCCIMKLCDTQKLTASQSGGAFFAVAEYILGHGGIVYGVSNEDKYDVCTVRVTDVKDLPKLQKSKYVQSDSSKSFQYVATDLREGKTVFYSGTACVIQGLKNYINKNRVPQEKLLTCDLICHGVPSRLIDRDYVAYMEKKAGQTVVSQIYRDKRFGWGSHKETYIFEDCHEESTNDKVIVFSKGYALSPACFQCGFTTPYRTADLTIGDFWTLENLGMSQTQFELGLSVCIVRNKKIAEILSELTARKVIEYSDIKLEDAMQWNLERPSVRPANYDEFWKMYQRNRFKNLKPVYFALTPKERAARIYRTIFHKLKSY